MKQSKELVYALAAHFKKDHRTIQSWFDDNDPMIKHPDTVKIISDFNKKKDVVISTK